MNMGDHWDWAIQQSIQQFSPTHIIVLTDRMVFRGQAVTELSLAASSRLNSVISYLHDRVNDVRTPVILERQRYSEGLFKLECRRLLHLSSQCIFHPSLPRLLNTLTPVASLEKVKTVFGDYCKSVSPDFGFAYRYLATHSELLYYDKALTIHSGIARSNGASTTRGVLSRDALKFRAGNALLHAPYPEVFSLGNSILEEYCRVKAACVERDLPPLNKKLYFKMLLSDALSLEDVNVRDQFLVLLKKRGHKSALFWHGVRRAFKLTKQQMKKRLTRARGDHKELVPALLFASVDEALSYDRDYPLPPSEGVEHLNAINAFPLKPDSI